MENIEKLVMQRQALKARIDELNEDLAQINADILSEYGNEEFDGSREVAGYRVSVSRKATFKPLIAEKLIQRKRIPAAVKKQLYKEVIDGQKVKALLPDLYAESQVIGAPFVSVREAD